MPSAITLTDLSVRHGDLLAVDDVSFEVADGEVLALLGPNGAGKTTTVETLEGYRSPDFGSVRVLGLDPVADKRALVPSIGVMLQHGGVYPVMSPKEALTLFAGYYATFGLAKLTIPSGAWQVAFSIFGAIVVGITAWTRMALLPSQPERSIARV